MQGATNGTRTSARTSKCFNPRPRAGGDFARTYIRSTIIAFQSTPPCRGRLGAIIFCRHFWTVSIHAPVQGATTLASGQVSHNTFQSTPPCRGRPFHIKQSSPRATVSIHAPVQGATYSVAPNFCHKCVSIHAPVQGATVHLCIGINDIIEFQSTPPCRGRHLTHN